MTDDSIRVAFGEYARQSRTAAKLSLRAAQALVGVSNSYLYQIEKGERNPPKPAVLLKMASAYGVTLDSLMAAARLQEPGENALFYECDELERAFEYVRTDRRFRFGRHMEAACVPPDVKRFVVEMYQALTDRQLIEAAKKGGATDGPGVYSYDIALDLTGERP